MSVIRGVKLWLGRGVNRWHGRLVWGECGLKIGCDRWRWCFRRRVWLFCIATVTPMDIMSLRTAVVCVLEFSLVPTGALEGGRSLPARVGRVLREGCARWAGRDGSRLGLGRSVLSKT